MKDSITRLDYCQYLLVSQINYTLTNFAEHSERFCHDTINRYLREERITPRLVCQNISSQVITSEQGYVVFDDTVLDKQYSYRPGAPPVQWQRPPRHQRDWGGYLYLRQSCT